MQFGKSSVVCFSDAAFASHKNGGSQGAFIIFLYRNNKYDPIAWTSRKLKRVMKSTLSAETLALKKSLETCFIKSLFVELIGKASYQNIIPICCYTANIFFADTINSTITLKMIANGYMYNKRDDREMRGETNNMV